MSDENAPDVSKKKENATPKNVAQYPVISPIPRPMANSDLLWSG